MAAAASSNSYGVPIQKGLVTILLNEIFSKIQNEKEYEDREFTVKASYLEIYN